MLVGKASGLSDCQRSGVSATVPWSVLGHNYQARLGECAGLLHHGERQLRVGWRPWGNRWGNDHKSGVTGDGTRRVRRLFHRHDNVTFEARPAERDENVAQSRPIAAVDATPQSADAAEDLVDEAGLTAASLVAQGQTELMQARAEAACIQAGARERLVELIKREHAVAEMESAARSEDPGHRSMADARHQATEIVASARQTAIGLLEEAQHVLIASCRQASSSPRPGGSELPFTPEPESRTELDDAAVVLDLTTDERVSRYARQSARLPKIGDEAESTLADMKRLRALSKGRDA